MDAGDGDDDDDDDVGLQPPAADTRLPLIDFRATYTIAAAPKTGQPPEGDKILLPPTALAELLSAAAAARRRPAAAAAFSYAAAAAASSYDTAAAADAFDLPQPLTFRLEHAQTGAVAFAGVREFSADAGEAVLSDYLRDALQVGQGGGGGGGGGDRVHVRFHPLPKGRLVTLRPLEPGYNPADWRPLLERQLRGGYTTLTRGAVLEVRGSRGPAERFRFAIEALEPADAPGVCVVDTDLEVVIQPFAQDGADGDAGEAAAPPETLKWQPASSAGPAHSAGSSSIGGPIDIWKPVDGQVQAGAYVDYELASWDRSRPLAIVLTPAADDEPAGDRGYAVDLLVSPFSTRCRVPPRATEHVWAHFGPADPADGTKTLVLPAAAAELETAETLRIAVHGWQMPEAAANAKTAATSTPPPPVCRYTLRVRTVLEDDGTAAVGGGGGGAGGANDGTAAHGPDEAQCTNCLQWVPRRTMVLHESFCLRNNVACPQCKQVFQKRSAAWEGHWHCAYDPDDGGRGSSAASRAKHDRLFHPGFASPDLLWACPADTCAGGAVAPFPSLPALARHRTTTCPAKLILCQFCQLEVPQEGDPADPSVDAATVLTGLTPHERADGARTTDCYLCGAIVRMRDMRAHLQHHDLDRQRRVPPDVCRDALCGRTRFGVGPRGQIKGPPPPPPPPDGLAGPRAGSGTLGLCGTCFAPLYVSTHDPEGKALRRRVERRYLMQLMTGCGKAWCANPWCKTGRQNQHMEPLGGGGGGSGGGTAALLPLVRPLVAEAVGEPAKPVHFCVDEESQKRRAVAELLAGQGGGVYALPWCVAACEAEGADAGRAWEWLSNWAPQQRAATSA